MRLPAARLTKIIFISDELRLVKIGKYGKEDPTMVGGWDGIIGEIVRKVEKNKHGLYFCASFIVCVRNADTAKMKRED